MRNRHIQQIKKHYTRGFTLIEIMIVVMIIGILLAIALPGFVQARETSRTKACVENLRKIDTAKTQYCMDNILSPTATVPGGLPTLVVAGSNYLRAAPFCPSGGTYVLNNFSTNPTCSIGLTGTGNYASTGEFYHGIP